MDGHAAMAGERAIRRLAALLLSLAVVAERAAARSWPVRCFVLWLLRRAEALSADYVFDVTGVPASALEAIAAVRNSPDEAILLAARFRLLAALLGVLLPDPCGPDDRSLSLAVAVDRNAPWPRRALGGWTPEAYDTS